MAKSKSQNNGEVISLEVEEIPNDPIKIIEENISNQLVKANLTESVIQKLKDDYLGLKINGINDRDGYDAVHDGRIVCKNMRVLAEKICKKGREQAILEQKKWIEKKKDVSGRISLVENHLQVMEDAYDAEREKLKAERIAAEALRLKVRMKQLMDMGATTDGINIEMGDVSYELIVVRESDEDVYLKLILPKYRAIFDANEIIRIEEENRKAELELAEAQRKADLGKAELELKRQQDLLKAEQEKIEAEKQHKIDAENKEKERIEAELQSKRLELITPYSAFGKWVNLATLYIFSDEDFNFILAAKKEEFEANEKKVAEERAIAQEAEKQAAIEKALAEAKQKQEQEAKDAENKRIVDEQKRQADLDAASDKVKWADFIAQLDKLIIPTGMKSGQYKTRVNMAHEKITELKSL